MGDSNFSISFARLDLEKDQQTPKVKIMYCMSERNLGSRNIDQELLKHFSKYIENEYGYNPSSEAKIKLRLLNGLQKARCQLTTNETIDFTVDSIIDGDDFTSQLSKKELDKICSEFKSKLNTTLNKAIDEFKQLYKDVLLISDIKIDAIELTGEATRIPLVQESIKEIEYLEPIQQFRTLNT